MWFEGEEERNGLSWQNKQPCFQIAGTGAGGTGAGAHSKRKYSDSVYKSDRERHQSKRKIVSQKGTQSMRKEDKDTVHETEQYRSGQQRQ